MDALGGLHYNTWLEINSVNENCVEGLAIAYNGGMAQCRENQYFLMSLQDKLGDGFWCCVWK